MNLHQLRTQFSRTRFTLIVAFALLVMLYLGYQLAQFNFAQMGRETQQVQTTNENLLVENESLTKRVNELLAQLEISELANEALDTRIKEGLNRERDLNEQIRFYQNVVAPELSEEGFSIDGIQVATTASPGYYQLSLVLIQQTRVKATINGNLNIRVQGSLNGEPTTVSINQQNTTPDSDFSYSFKYFQTIYLMFTLPEGFVPERMLISTDIRQYRRSRGRYERIVEWSSIAENT